MPIELKGGTTNRLFLDPQSNRVLKEFVGGNGMVQSFQKRRAAEEWSMKNVPIAPEYRGSDQTHVAMSFVDGERDIDGQVDQLSESLQHQVYFESGKALASIHDTVKFALPKKYHLQHLAEVVRLIQATKKVLAQNGVNTLDLIDFMKASYDRNLVEKSGLVWTHGDYWLRNVIGTLGNNLFTLSSVIDWETAWMNSPYDDFAIVEMSVERAHGEPAQVFWDGYGKTPDRHLQRHYSIAKTMEWITGEDENVDFSSDFYQTKFNMMKETLR